MSLPTHRLPFISARILAEILPALSYDRSAVLRHLTVIVHMHHACQLFGHSEDTTVEREVRDDSRREARA